MVEEDKVQRYLQRTRFTCAAPASVSVASRVLRRARSRAGC